MRVYKIIILHFLTIYALFLKYLLELSRVRRHNSHFMTCRCISQKAQIMAPIKCTSIFQRSLAYTNTCCLFLVSPTNSQFNKAAWTSPLIVNIIHISSHLVKDVHKTTIFLELAEILLVLKNCSSVHTQWQRLILLITIDIDSTLPGEACLTKKNKCGLTVLKCKLLRNISTG